MHTDSGLTDAVTVRLFVLLSSCIVFFDCVILCLCEIRGSCSSGWVMMPCRLGDKYRHFRGTALSSSGYTALTNEVVPCITCVVTG
jgi:hypothetical protein